MRTFIYNSNGVMFCPKCGASCSDDARFCKKCGASFKREGEEAVPKQPKQGDPSVQPDARATRVAPKPATAKSKAKLSPPVLVGIGAAIVGVVLIVVSFMVGLPGSDGGSASTSPGPAKLNDGSWTVLVYLCGSNLESEDGYATQNLEEIVSADLSNKVNLLIETGGSNTSAGFKWKYDY